LYKPRAGYQLERNLNTDTPLPPEEPAGKNPPDGATIYYYLDKPATLLTLEVFDSSGKSVRRFASDDKPEPVNAEELQLPTYWIRPQQILSAQGGCHRFVWDLRLAPPPGPKRYPISAIYMDTPGTPLGAWVAPGTYSVTLTVDGVKRTQTIDVNEDPRKK
jgi:hypothetical protein